MAQGRILVVEDDVAILELLTFNLCKEGYTVFAATSGEEALKRARTEKPDLILLDVMLPVLDGLEVCRILKREPDTKHIPVIMLTARSEETDVVVGLELGAEDYITKPFSPKVVIARVRTALRRTSGTGSGQEEVVKVHNLLMDVTRRQVLVSGRPVELSFSEFGILLTLARRPGWVFTRAQIVDAVRGDDYPVTERSIDVHIVALRKKLTDAGKFIETVRGVGYRFAEPGVPE